MIPLVLSPELRQRLEMAFVRHRQCRVSRLSPSAVAFLAWCLQENFRRTVVVVSNSARTLDDLHQNLCAFVDDPAKNLLYYPAWEILPAPKARPQMRIVGDRMNCLSRLASGSGPFMVATCIQALMQTCLSSAELKRRTVRLAVKEDREPTDLCAVLQSMGYEWVPEVQDKGQASMKGGILDCWSPSESTPYRVEFFGSTVESIRAFDAADQRSLARLSEIVLLPVAEWALMQESESSRTSFMSRLSSDTVYVWVDAETADSKAAVSVGGIAEHAAAYEDIVKEHQSASLHLTFDEVRGAIAARSETWELFAGWQLDWQSSIPTIDLGFKPVEGMYALQRGALEPDVSEAERGRFLDRLEERAGRGIAVHLFFHTQGSLDRFKQLFPERHFDLHLGRLSVGFDNESLGLIVVSELDLMGYRKMPSGRYDATMRRRRHQKLAGESITDWTRIEPGDLVVHVDHGIGRYLGLYEITFDGRLQEALTIEYADKAKLYVPVSQTHLLSRYLGVGKRHVLLHRLGGARWGREKAAAEKAIRDLAASLLETQAARESMEGVDFGPDVPWQHEFESAFPYEETEDQERAVAEMKADMQSHRPMDRLMCGDVGYGKTEVAMRGAFKAVMGGKQVAVLVPTTVLAQQHYELFSERMAAYPIRVELLCRFRTQAEQDQVVKDLGEGAVDIVIGTHRLLQPDIRFKDLGLVIIDEEQRFGVANKEQLKHVKRLVEVLTLTATPIPRTLYMSLMGARDISMIQTPPKERQSIETVVAENRDVVVREAILRELNRGGQVYYLHNRVRTIEKVGERLCRIVPEARVDVGHGQMPTTDLASVMRRFARGEFDVLLCTTIIESGVDIPNVNTILIDRADRFGMADLYQLRGRVGRSSRKAYAYMLLPPHGHILDTARRRINAMMEYTDLGAGFRLALRDLEIRGSGNILGAEQSGHITAVGFELYCQLLRHTVAQMSGRAEEGPMPAVKMINVDLTLDFIDYASASADAERSAILPLSYVEDERLRIHVYRKIASAVSLEEMKQLEEELTDRFGPIPPSLERVMKIASLRIMAVEKGVTAIETRDDKLMFKRNQDYLMMRNYFPRLRASTTDKKLDEIRQWLNRVTASGFSHKGNLENEKGM